MYESRNMPLLPFRDFLKRLLLHFGGAVLLVMITLLAGMAGHMLFDTDITWHDATLNSAFIANGIGPYLVPQNLAGKVFFAIYGMFTSFVFMTTLGMVLAPVAHRLVHKFHLDDEA
ncbi:two pore domain potassium channel family protein [Erwinia sorbitola]|uniref:Two pore domain potassium channel family protein n=1 Tax=Erwinia sorbitola TaxID=2681984 RepID=A0A6I6ESC3_9GAMM|nr:two pore domain potassium channel family protein [Erwinia sorbitola]MTD26323.1 two pore domain potassium channel family protein [Erwinia sorbitola]QGU87153.1 two pore domain potassium channel family protein [Erwinia sorbitola]